MSRPPMKALEQIKRYCEKTQCRRCVFGEKSEMLSNDLDYVGCKLQQECPCEWEIEERSDKCSKCEYHINPDYTRCKKCGAESEEV